MSQSFVINGKTSTAPDVYSADGLGKDLTADVLTALAAHETVTKVTTTVGTEGAVAANTIEVACVVKDLSGTAITAATKVTVISTATTAGQGDIAAAGTPVGTIGAVQDPATGDNVAVFTTTAAGLFSFSIANTAAETNAVTIIPNGGIATVLVLTFA